MAKHMRNNIVSLEEVKHAKVVGKHSRLDYDQELDNQEEEYYKDRDMHQGQAQSKTMYAVLRSSIIGVMVLILAFFGVLIFDLYVVEDIQVVGNDLFEYFEIIEWSGIEYKQSILSLDEAETITRIEELKPMIEVESVQKTLPNTIVITVRERAPMCYLVLKGSQKCAIIGDNNICLDIVDSYLETDIPIIKGIDIGECQKGSEIVDSDERKLEALKEILFAMEKEDCKGRFSSISLQNTTNIVMETFDDNTIKIGDTSNIDNKITCVVKLLDHYTNTGQAGKTIIVTGDNAIYTEQDAQVQ